MSAAIERLARESTLGEWAKREAGSEPQINRSMIIGSGDGPHGFHFEMRLVDQGMGHFSEEYYDVVLMQQQRRPSL
jgi:hypothetical protein